MECSWYGIFWQILVIRPEVWRGHPRWGGRPRWRLVLVRCSMKPEGSQAQRAGGQLKKLELPPACPLFSGPQMTGHLHWPVPTAPLCLSPYPEQALFLSGCRGWMGPSSPFWLPFIPTACLPPQEWAFWGGSVLTPLPHQHGLPCSSVPLRVCHHPGPRQNRLLSWRCCRGLRVNLHAHSTAWSMPVRAQHQSDSRMPGCLLNTTRLSREIRRNPSPCPKPGLMGCVWNASLISPPTFWPENHSF